MNGDPLSAAKPSKGSIVPVLAGGGGRLSAHIGVLRAIEDLDLSYRTLVGVSGGSIVGALVAAGFTLDKVRSVANETDFSRFSANSLLSLLRTGGFSSGMAFRVWMDELLEGRCFADLELDFRVVATDVKSGRPVIFSPASHPQMPVAQAVRYSMSVPILFSFQSFEDHLLVDGSILSEDALQRDWRGDNTPVVVFKLRSHGNGDPVRTSRIPLRNYLEMLVHTFMTTISREYINEDFWLSTVVVDVGNISPINLGLSRADKDRLYAAGYGTTRDILPVKMARR